MKSLYLKLFSRILVILLISLLTLILAFFPQIFRFSQEKNSAALFQDAQRVASAYSFLSDTSTNSYHLFSQVVHSITDESDVQVLVADISGRVRYTASRGNFVFHPTGNSARQISVISTDVTERLIMDGTYSAIGTLEGYYAWRVHSVGVISYSDSSHEIVGFVFLSTAPKNLNAIAVELLLAALLSLLLVVTAALPVSFWATYSITRSIKAVTDAAITYSQGDFSVRVPPITDSTELTALGNTFNQMAAAMEHIEHDRQDFSANITHELKTPLTTITGFVNGILDGTIPPERQNYYLHIVSDESQRLSRMISQTLLAARLASGEKEIEPKPFDLAEDMRRTLLGFENLADQKKLECILEIPDKFMVMGDRDSILQVIYNLTDNAIKYAYQGGMLRLSLLEQGGKAHVEVFNTGKGIDSQILPFIFDRFYKADQSRGVDRNSFGLGLYIVKAILNRHHEAIKVESEVGVYCMFSFDLPLA